MTWQPSGPDFFYRAVAVELMNQVYVPILTHILASCDVSIILAIGVTGSLEIVEELKTRRTVRQFQVSLCFPVWISGWLSDTGLDVDRVTSLTCCDMQP